MEIAAVMFLKLKVYLPVFLMSVISGKIMSNDRQLNVDYGIFKDEYWQSFRDVHQHNTARLLMAGCVI